METLVSMGVMSVAVIGVALAQKYWIKFQVPEGYYALLYRSGKYQHRLSPGKHRYWGKDYTIHLVDVRKCLMNVPGQEMLTADNVSVKVTVMLVYQLVQVEKAVHEVESYMTHLYHVVQLATRAVVSSATMDTLLTQRAEMAKQLLARIQPEADKIGIVAHAAEVKDVILPAELKKAFADVLKAKQEGQAALERARGETAALRSLANAAHMMESTPALLNLRLMQSIASGSTSGSTLVMGLPTGFVPMKNGKPAQNEGQAKTDK